MVIRGYNNFLAGRLVRYGASVEHGPEIYGVYLCNNLDKVNRDKRSASLFIEVGCTSQYFNVEAAIANCIVLYLLVLHKARQSFHKCTTKDIFFGVFNY